jgi:hypothetical protein
MGADERGGGIGRVIFTRDPIILNECDVAWPGFVPTSRFMNDGVCVAFETAADELRELLD